MSLRRKLLELIEQGFQEERAFVAGLTDEERAVVGASDDWSAKDVLAHIAAWKERWAESFITWTRESLLITFEEYDRINAQDFEEHRDHSWEQVLAQGQRSCELLVESVKVMQEPDLRVIPEGNRALWTRFAGAGYTHPVLHISEYLMMNGKPTEASRLRFGAFERLLELDDDPWWQGVCNYNLACNYALTDKPEKAIETLSLALEFNPELTDWSQDDQDFASIRDNPDYLALYTD